ncbi:CTLH domain-containing protein [Mycena sanguinolenta]|uniref:CTLH domain-containing protein n=1 Tax=Mycena sanguinolenta TaxID=230812 RepID=A0A8H6ZB78_9AGAR|nr:CTLH domain-containing protein [Mycena sanguinolenta]
MLRLPEALVKLDDHQLHGQFIIATFRAWQFYPLAHPQQSIDDAIEHFRISKDPEGEAQLHIVVGQYYLRIGNIAQAENFYRRAVSLAAQCNSDLHVWGTYGLATTQWARGNYSEGLRLARETYKMGVIRGDFRAQSNGMRHQALCYKGLGDFKHTLQVVKEGKELLALAGMQGGAGENMFMNTEANVYKLKGEYTAARQIHETILHQTSSTLSPLQHGYALLNLASIDIVSGASIEVVSRNLTIALSLFKQLQHARGVSACEHLSEKS